MLNSSTQDSDVSGQINRKTCVQNVSNIVKISNNKEGESEGENLVLNRNYSKVRDRDRPSGSGRGQQNLNN